MTQPMFDRVMVYVSDTTAGPDHRRSDGARIRFASRRARMTLKPIPIRVLRHACPHCGRTHSRPGRAREHMARCWQNPEAKGCKTCKHFRSGIPGENDTGWPGEPEHCTQGVDLTGHRACPGCGGWGWKGISSGAEVPCNAEVTVGHIGDGREAKPGPIIGCASWEIDLEAAVEWLARVAGLHAEVTP